MSGSGKGTISEINNGSATKSAAPAGADSVAGNLVDKLLESFNELDRCIAHTRTALSEKSGVPDDILSRVEQYSSIVSKQRNLALGLREHLSLQNWDEVARHVRLINGLSGMIRDDAQAILGGARDSAGPERDRGLV